MQLSRWSTSEDDGDRKKQAEPEVQQATMQSDAPSRRRALRQALHPFSTCQESRPSLVSRTTPKYKVYAVPDTFVAKCASNTPITTPPPPPDYTCALCNRPQGTAVCRIEIPHCVKTTILHRFKPMPTVHRFPPPRDMSFEVALYHVRRRGPPQNLVHGGPPLPVLPRSPPHFSLWGQDFPVERYVV